MTASKEVILEGLKASVEVHQKEIGRLTEEQGKVWERMCAPSAYNHLIDLYAEYEERIHGHVKSVSTLKSQINKHTKG